MKFDIKSEFMTLRKNDFVKGLVVAAVAGALGVIQPAITAGTLLSMAVLQGAGQAAAAGGIAYLAKNLFTNSQGQMGKAEPPPPASVGDIKE
jgi:hypothetical protein